MINSMDVFLDRGVEKLFVGKLAYHQRAIYFEYDSEFIKRGIHLSPYKLPLKNGVQKCDDRVFDGLFGVFADSLPDGWGRLLLDRWLSKRSIRPQDITPLDYLSYTGEYGVGALRYKPIVEDIEKEEIGIDLDRFANSSLKIFQGESEKLLDTLLKVAGSSAGARPKAMVQIDKEGHIIYGQQPLQKSYKHYVVKFPGSMDDVDIGKVEYIYSLIAKDAGICIPATKLLQGEKNSYFAIERFDRDGDMPIHMHSVAGLVHSDFRLPALDYDDLLALTMDITKDINEVYKMFRLACFNLFMHNRDDHAKNFSFLLTSDGWKLSPAYDLTYSNGPGGEYSTTYLGEGRHPTTKQLLSLGDKHLLKDTKAIIDQTREACSNFSHYASMFNLSDRVAKAIKSDIMLS